MQKKKEALNAVSHSFKRLAFEIMAPVQNKPRLKLKLFEFQSSYAYTQVNLAQINDIWQLWNETQFCQKSLIAYQDLCEFLFQGWGS